MMRRRVLIAVVLAGVAAFGAAGLACDPVGADAYRAAVAAAAREQYAEAEGQLRACVRENPDFGEAHLALGTMIVTQVAESSRMEPDEMHRRFRDAVEHWRLARACFAAGRYVTIAGLTDADKRAETQRHLAEYEPILALLEGDIPDASADAVANAPSNLP